jgi:putative transposase
MPVRPVLHGDNGATLKATTVLAMLHWLGIEPSYSRPRVSDDNAFAEALFRTAKYRPEFPLKGFAELDAARQWAVRFVKWYKPRASPQRHPLRHRGAASCRAGWSRAHRSPRDLPRRALTQPATLERADPQLEAVGAVTLNPERDIIIRAATLQILLSGSIGEPAFPSRPGSAHAGFCQPLRHRVNRAMPISQQQT